MSCHPFAFWRVYFEAPYCEYLTSALNRLSIGLTDQQAKLLTGVITYDKIPKIYSQIVKGLPGG